MGVTSVPDLKKAFAKENRPTGLSSGPHTTPADFTRVDSDFEDLIDTLASSSVPAENMYGSEINQATSDYDVLTRIAANTTAQDGITTLCVSLINQAYTSVPYLFFIAPPTHIGAYSFEVNTLNGEYVLTVGSGISTNVSPGTPDLITDLCWCPQGTLYASGYELDGNSASCGRLYKYHGDSTWLNNSLDFGAGNYPSKIIHVPSDRGYIWGISQSAKKVLIVPTEDYTTNDTYAGDIDISLGDYTPLDLMYCPETDKVYILCRSLAGTGYIMVFHPDRSASASDDVDLAKAFPSAAGFMTYNAYDKKIYVVVGGSVTANSEMIYVVNPASKAITKTITNGLSMTFTPLNILSSVVYDRVIVVGAGAGQINYMLIITRNELSTIYQKKAIAPALTNPALGIGIAEITGARGFPYGLFIGEEKQGIHKVQLTSNNYLPNNR